MYNYQEQICNILARDTLAQIEEKLAAFGVSVRKEDGTFKTLYQVIEELAEKCFEQASANTLANMADVKDIMVD